MVYNKNLALFRNKTNGFCFYINAKDAMKYINYEYRSKHFHDYSKASTTKDGGSINYIPEIIKVKVAKQWQDKLSPTEAKIEDLKVTSDWTYTTPYKGSITHYTNLLESAQSLFDKHIDNNPVQNYLISETPEKIPLERLTPENPIEFFSDVIFFEDELDDFGKVELRLRFRCMKDCAFGLLRCYLRYSKGFIKKRLGSYPQCGHAHLHRLR